jgi:acetyl-CoA C-acetyltransferase
MTASPVFILGGHQTDYARNYAREGLEVSDLVADGVAGTLAAAGVDATDIEAVHVGNAFGQLFNGQGHLGAMPATVEPELWGVPSARHEAACASASIAVLAAMAEIEAGRYDCILVLGVEQERNVPGDLAARHMGAAAWVGHEAQEAKFVWPSQFSDLADEYDRRYGIDRAHIAALAELNLTNAKHNPNAQTRAWDLTPASFEEDDVANPVVEGRTRRTDCSQVTDGAAGLVLASRRHAEQWASDHGRDLDAVARIAGWGHRSAGLDLATKLRRSEGEPYVFPHVRRAVTEAWERAGVAGPEQLDGIEVHDCFAVTEYMIVDHLGLAEPGAPWKAIENGDLAIGGALPVNPSGGLIGVGHPVGASGARMVLDATKQVTGCAGGYQVDRARTFATLNIGGSTTTTVSFVVSTDPTTA